MNRAAVWIAAVAIVAALAVVAIVWNQGPQLVVEEHAIIDISPGNRSPRFVLAVVVSNQGDVPIEIRDEPSLRVRSVNTGGHLEVVATPIETAPLRIAPGQRVELVYDLWRLANLYGQGIFPELRRSPGDMRFVFQIETDAGGVESDEWSGLSSGTDVGKFLGELRGGTGL